MQIDLINGFTSFKIVKSMAFLMDKHGVTDDYRCVSKYYSCTKQKNMYTGKPIKNIYIAYDSLSFINEDKINLEIEHFDRCEEPHLIVVFSDDAEKYYRKRGYNVYQMGFGYDDYTYQPKPREIKYDIGFSGSIDRERHSSFYHRYMLGCALKEFNFIDRDIKALLTNDKEIDADTLYSQSLVGLNDMIYAEQNMRLFEIPVNGAYMLVNDLVQKVRYPMPTKYYSIYLTVGNLLDKLKYLLENEDDTKARGLEAQKFIMDYPISNEVKKMIQVCCLNEPPKG